MPYIQIKGYPKDEATKKAVAAKVTDVFAEMWGCAREAITVSIEEVAPDDWNEKIVIGEIEPNMDNVFIHSGKPVK